MFTRFTFRVPRSLNASSSDIVRMNKFREIECLDLTNSTRCNIRVLLERSNSKKDRRLKYQGIYSRARRSAISTVQAKPRWNWGIHICSVTTKNPIPASEIILRLSTIKPDEFQIDKSATAL